MLGLILLLVLKVCSSDAVEATVGSNITLECTVSGLSYQWQKHLGTHWGSIIQSSSKYMNVNTAILTINNIDVDDAGTYRCTATGSGGSQQSSIILVVTDTDGTWTPWSQWTMCSKTCGVGTSTRNRGCTGSNCDGTGVESLDCATIPCPVPIVNGNWGIWGAWSACSTTCGSGTWTRYRSCDNPAPATGGSYCSGLDYETTQCIKPSCPGIVNGRWSEWGAWSACSTTCGDGILTRYRSCDNPAPANGGSDCSGLDYETTPCYKSTCPVNGRWSEWRAWSACSTTCGSGTWTRYRSCDNPAPANGGSYCSGSENETTPCYAPICPVHGHWGAWHDWNSCSATCDIGSRSRYQECNNPEPSNGGTDCQGNDTEIESCSIKLCPVPSAEDNSSASVGIGAGIGSTVVVIGLLIGLFVVLKRYRLGKPAECAIYTTAGDTASSNADLHIYSGLQQNTASPTHRQNGVIYDNLIIWKKTNSC